MRTKIRIWPFRQGQQWRTHVQVEPVRQTMPVVRDRWQHHYENALLDGNTSEAAARYANELTRA